MMFFNEPPKPEVVLKALLEQPAKLLSQVLSGNNSGSGAQAAPSVLLLKSAPGSSSASSASAAAPADFPVGVILVTGATGGVGKRVVQHLLAAGLHVRALVRDVAKAKQLLADLPLAPGGRLELVAADLTQRRTLLPDMFEGVRAVVSCAAVKVAPKEGDTAERSKYYQGIKFYDPEVVGDTPEAVELGGMTNLLDALGGRLGSSDGQVILDASGTSRWGPLDDVVMGGVSESTLTLAPPGAAGEPPAAAFRGLVSTANSGGFASVRSRNFGEAGLDLGAYQGLALRVRGNGLRFKMIVRTDANWDGIAYCRSFDTTDGEWQTVFLPFSEFKPVFRARSLKDGPALDPSKVASIQLMLSKFEYDGELNPNFEAGPFELPIQWIKAVPVQPLKPRFIHVSSAGVTRPNRPGIDVEAEPPAVRLNDALGGLLTYKLAGEDAVRTSGVPFVVVRPTALTEEPAGAPLLVDQGDTIKGKISREDVADLCVALLTLPVATNTTFEIKSTLPFSTPWVADPAALGAGRDWSALLSGAGLLERVTGKTVGGVYTGKEPEPTEGGVVRRQEAPVVV